MQKQNPQPETIETYACLFFKELMAQRYQKLQDLGELMIRAGNRQDKIKRVLGHGCTNVTPAPTNDNFFV